MSREKLMNFDSIYLEYKDYIYRTCILYLKDHHLAEDCTQDVFIKVYKKQKSYKGKSSLKTWITRICINCCRDMLRKRKAEDNLDESLPEDESDHTKKLIVSEAIISLPLQFREVVILYYYREFTMKEIAEITPTKIPNVEYRIRRAKELLKERLGDDFCE